MMMYSKGLWLFVDLIIACILMFLVGSILSGLLLDLFDSYPRLIIHSFVNIFSLSTGIAYLSIKYKIGFTISWYKKNNFIKIVIWGSISGLILGLFNLPYSVLSGESEIPQEYFVDPKNGAFLVSIYLFFVVVLAPLIEEILLRGIIYKIVKKKFNIFLGVFVSTFLFWAAHNFYVPIIFSSLLYCYIYEKTNLVGTSVLAHFILNLLWYSAIYYKALFIR